MKRYNPDTGRQVTVDRDSFEAENWPTRKPSQRTRQRFEREVTRAGERVVKTALPAVSRAAAAVQEAAPTLPHKVFVAAVGVAAFRATQAVQDAIAEGKTDRAFIAAMAFRRGRVALEQQVGRRVTREELVLLRRKIAEAIALDQLVARTAPFGVGYLTDLIRRAF